MTKKTPLCNCKTTKKLKGGIYYGHLVPTKTDSKGLCIDCGYYAVNSPMLGNNDKVEESWDLRYIPGLFKEDSLLPWYWNWGGW